MALSANEIVIKGNALYVADGLGGIKIIMITNPTNTQKDDGYED